VVKEDGDKIRRTWVFRYYLKGQEIQIGLGSFNKGVTLDAARKQAVGLRQQINEGLDPAQVKKQQKAEYKIVKNVRASTFKEVAQTFYDNHHHKWRNAKHAAQFLSTLAQYAYPIIGKMPVGDIKREHIIQVLEQPTKKKATQGKFWDVKKETADRVRSRIEQVLDFATVRDLREGPNPAEWKGNLAFAFPQTKDQPDRNHPALHWEALPDFMIELRERDAVAAKALEFLILTAARTGEVLGARWSEIDLGKRLWTIPSARMKIRKNGDHQVPLSNEAIAILKSLRGDIEDENPFVFPGPITDCLSGMSLLMLLRRMGRPDITVHGFRSTFRDWVRDDLRQRHSREMAEAALAHVNNNKAEAAYARSQMVELRRGMMQTWANHCAGKDQQEAPNIVTFKAPEKAA
jgi:integrase